MPTSAGMTNRFGIGVVLAAEPRVVRENFSKHWNRKGEKDKGITQEAALVL
jgi:hypothetical protein